MAKEGTEQRTFSSLVRDVSSTGIGSTPREAEGGMTLDALRTELQNAEDQATAGLNGEANEDRRRKIIIDAVHARMQDIVERFQRK